jgi:type II secretory pathway pseudopilin PulG
MTHSPPERRHAFTLVELLAVVGIMVVLFALLIPAFTGSKSAGDITRASYDVAGALETARAYAQANNTYVWVGFFEEDGSGASQSPAVSGTGGRVVISIAASRDGSHPNGGAAGLMDPTKLVQVAKLIKIDNVHLAAFPDGSGTGSDFEGRPPAGGRIGGGNPIGAANPAGAGVSFQYPVGGVTSPIYTFDKNIEFNSRGENAINGTDDRRPVVEIGLQPQPTHGSAIEANSRNVAAIQITGITGNVKIYRQ